MHVHDHTLAGGSLNAADHGREPVTSDGGPRRVHSVLTETRATVQNVRRRRSEQRQESAATRLICTGLTAQVPCLSSDHHLWLTIATPPRRLTASWSLLRAVAQRASARSARYPERLD